MLDDALALAEFRDLRFIEREAQSRRIVQYDALVDRGLGVSLVPDWAPTKYAGISVRKWALPRVAPKRLVGLIRGRSCARIRLVHAFLDAAESIERTRQAQPKLKR